MFKKMLLVAMAAGALVAFAAPAMASAAEWKVNGAPLEEETTIEFTGSAQFGLTPPFPEVGAHAVLHIQVTLSPGSTGVVEGLVATECTGTGGYTGLTCHVSTNLTPTNQWVLHCEANGTMRITNIDLTNRYTPEGLAANTTLTGNVTGVATPNNEEIESIDLSDAGEVLANGVPADVSGELELVAPHTGIIGCV